MHYILCVYINALCILPYMHYTIYIVNTTQQQALKQQPPYHCPTMETKEIKETKCKNISKK